MTLPTLPTNKICVKAHANTKLSRRFLPNDPEVQVIPL